MHRVDPYLKHPHFAYVIGGNPIRGTGLVKIGWAQDVDKRLKDLQIGSPVILRAYRAYLGGKCLERYLHRRFKKDRKHGEWFRLTGSLDDIDAEVRKWQSAAREGHCCDEQRRAWADAVLADGSPRKQGSPELDELYAASAIHNKYLAKVL